MRLLLLLILYNGLSLAQTPIRFCTMEDTCTWFPTRIPGTYSAYIGGNSSATDNPANTPHYASLDTAYRLLGIGLGNSEPEKDTLLFPNITGLDRTKRYTIRLKLSSIAYTPTTNLAAGMDIGDTIKIDWSGSNGVGWISEVVITGNNNASWGFNSTGTTVNKLSTLSSTYYSSSTSNPIKEVNLTLPLNVAQLRIRVVSRVNAIGESILIDDVQVLEPAVLPIQLESFTGVRIGNKIKLSWRTQSETNNDYFTIYRSQHGLEYWQLVANVQGAGNSSIPNDYNYIDPYPVNGLNYYVLMQTDYDGRREQFPPIVVMFVPVPINQSIWDRYNVLGQEIK